MPDVTAAPADESSNPTCPHYNTLAARILMMLKDTQSPLPDQAPAMECYIVLRGMSSAIYGSLSMTEDGLLRMMSPMPDSRPGRGATMIEQFFSILDVISIAVTREVNVSRVVARSS